MTEVRPNPQPMLDQFVAESRGNAWCVQVSSDRKLHPNAKNVAWLLRPEKEWSSYEYMAEAMGVCTRTVMSVLGVTSAPGNPLNIGRALRVAISMYRSRKEVQNRLGFRQYDRAIPVPEVFQVRCLETDELFDPELCSRVTAAERQSSNSNAFQISPNRRERTR